MYYDLGQAAVRPTTLTDKNMKIKEISFVRMFHKLYKYKFLINVDYRYYIIKHISILHL